MKQVLLGGIFSLALAFGIFALNTQPARANIQCMVTCVNEHESGLTACFTGCGYGSIGSIGCRYDCRRVWDRIRANCLRNCGICPQ